MKGKLGDRLPQALHRCGYRNIEFSLSTQVLRLPGLSIDPSDRYIFDQKRQKARKYNERDRVDSHNPHRRKCTSFFQKKRTTAVYIH